MGIPTVAAVVIPIVIVIGAIATSFQASSVRRFTSSTWAGYVALEAAESAVALASHQLKLEDLLDPALFGTGTQAQLVERLLDRMAQDQLPGIPAAQKEYWRLGGDDGSDQGRLMAAFAFPRYVKQIAITPLGSTIARDNPGVLDDLSVTVSPVTFRREYHQRQDFWSSWGILRFNVQVRAVEPRGPVTYRLSVMRLFSLKSGTGPGEEALKISGRNLNAVSERLL